MHLQNSISILFSLGWLVILAVSGHAKAEAGGDQRPSVLLPAHVTHNPGWTLQLPENEKAVFNGVVHYDASGPSGSAILYPAPNAGGFLAGLLTHAIILETMKDRKKTAAQEAADKVLAPYLDIVQAYTSRELMQRAVDKLPMTPPVQLTPYSEKQEAEWLIQSTPIFSLTQDQTALVLDNVISISQPGIPAYVNTIRIVSSNQEATDIVQHWTANQGEKLKALSASMVADSLQIALKGATGNLATDNTAYKTIRYYEGKTEKMERALLVSEQCNRTLIKTLRGWLMSIPVARSEAAPGLCTDTTAKLY